MLRGVNVNGGADRARSSDRSERRAGPGTLLYEMRRRDVRRGLAALCIGGGAGNRDDSGEVIIFIYCFSIPSHSILSFSFVVLSFVVFLSLSSFSVKENVP
jgi:hypothetical protein